MWALRQTFVLTPAMKVAVDRSVMQLTANCTYVIKSTNVHVQNMFRHVINYQRVSIASAIIIVVALQEYKECNNLPHGILGTTQCYNKCLKH
jgi:hypothetical protein